MSIISENYKKSHLKYYCFNLPSRREPLGKTLLMIQEGDYEEMFQMPHKIDMNKKLTLTVDKDVVARAKRYAEKEGTSLSKLVENYLKAATEKEGVKIRRPASITKSLRGSFNEPEGFDEKRALSEALGKKYLNG